MKRFHFIFLIFIVTAFGAVVPQNDTSISTTNAGIINLRSKNRGYFQLNLQRDPKTLLYYTSIKIGTFKKKVRMLVDLGYKELIIPSTSNTISNGNAFQKFMSSSYFSLPFEKIMFPYPNNASSMLLNGEYGSDSLELNRNSINRVKLLLDTSEQLKVGVFGLLFGNGTNLGETNQRNNLLNSLKEQGFIRKLSYVLDLRHKRLYFGAFNKNSIQGDLYMMPINHDTPDVQVRNNPYIRLNSIGFNGVSVVDAEFPTIFNSTDTLIRVPEMIFDALNGYFGTFSRDLNGYEIQCNSQGHNFQLTFDKKKIIIEYQSLIHELTSLHGVKRCILGIVPYEQNIISLGLNFLRNVVLVVNVEDNLLGIGQSRSSYVSNMQLIT